MTRAKLGDHVKVQYLGQLQDGDDVDLNGGRKVLEFTVGGKEVIPGISMGVVGMAEGEKKRMTLQPKDAFGVIRPHLIKEVSRQRFPSQSDLQVGKRLVATGRNSGRRRRVEVVEVRPDTVVVDGNHPLAGEVLEVEIKLISLDSSAKGGW